MKYCRYCGKRIDDDSTFCTYCGNIQSVQKTNFSIKKLGEIISNIWSKIKGMLRKICLPKSVSPFTFVRAKKWIKRIFIIVTMLIIIGLLILLGCWLYGFYITSKWTSEDECRETIAMTDISKADSIARVLFKEYSDNTHRYSFNFSRCNYSHIEKGVEILRNAAEKGDANAQFTLGCIYAGARYDQFYDWDDHYTMLGDAINNERAAYWYNMSAKQGHASAMLNLANSYRYGRGVEKDLVKATELMEASANKGNDRAQRNLGDMYRDGDVWFRAIVDSISGEALLINAKPNIEKAKEWWEKALKNGNESAKERLEKIYEDD